MKRYGTMSTCMTSRAIHIEVAFNLDTDPFFLALRRLFARRGNARSIYSDNGSNFIGAERELKNAYSEMNDNKVQSLMEGIGIILTMKSKLVMPPPGSFLRPDLYCRRQRRPLQHIANEFWSRWRKEYLRSLQERQKWNSRRRNFVIGDIVLLKTMDVSRNKWTMARVTATKCHQNGLVRNVYQNIGDHPVREKVKNIVEQPVDKIVLLIESNVFDPYQGPN